MSLQEGLATRWIELFKGSRGSMDSKGYKELTMSDVNKQLVQSRLESLQLPREFGSNCSGVFEYTGIA